MVVFDMAMSLKFPFKQYFPLQIDLSVYENGEENVFEASLIERKRMYF